METLRSNALKAARLAMCQRELSPMSQFESDVRIAEVLDKIYMEHGGRGNAYESYTAA